MRCGFQEEFHDFQTSPIGPEKPNQTQRTIACCFECCALLVVGTVVVGAVAAAAAGSIILSRTVSVEACPPMLLELEGLAAAQRKRQGPHSMNVPTRHRSQPQSVLLV